MRKERLQRAMDEKGLNVPSLSELSGIPERTIWRLIKQDENSTDATTGALADALDCSVDFLLGRSDELLPPVTNLTSDEMELVRSYRDVQKKKGKRVEAITILISE